uniref:Calponin-homology (CH) domain-containing protein n=1 Tax=Phasianus colchicus TaxID=9054 RepID=A0A669QNL7_PHACC
GHQSPPPGPPKPTSRIQQNTFTRWCNEHLKCVNKSIGDLQRDLGDGLRLIALLEVLSQKKMGRNSWRGRGSSWCPSVGACGVWGWMWGWDVGCIG